MQKPKLFLTIGFVAVCLIGIFLAVSSLTDFGYESDEGSLMAYTCEDVSAYETVSAEQDLASLTRLVTQHISSYDPSVTKDINYVLLEIDLLRDEVAFHTNDQQVYRNKFRELLTEIGLAELKTARTNLAEGQSIDENIKHAQHCLHDALVFSDDRWRSRQIGYSTALSELKNSGVTADGLNSLIEQLD
ncbi:MAG: hypothetical protein ACI8QD_000123 [Cyclobacteriaceae bacterium]|jgi:hypothetical protein